MYIIIGLGNPGLKYANTRHNIGFMAIDALAEKYKVSMTKKEHQSITGSFILDGEKVLLVKPQTFMNNSGECVGPMADYYHVPHENILVIYDDIDLELGRIRVRSQGSAGTHNGMKSIIAHLGAGDFPRLRLGIGFKPPQWDLANFVLAKFSDDEIEVVEKMCETTKGALEYFVTKGIEVMMNRVNRKNKKPKKKIQPTESEEKLRII